MYKTRFNAIAALVALSSILPQARAATEFYLVTENQQDQLLATIPSEQNSTVRFSPKETVLAAAARNNIGPEVVSRMNARGQSQIRMNFNFLEQQLLEIVKATLECHLQNSVEIHGMRACDGLKADRHYQTLLNSRIGGSSPFMGMEQVFDHAYISQAGETGTDGLGFFGLPALLSVGIQGFSCERNHRILHANRTHCHTHLTHGVR